MKTYNIKLTETDLQVLSLALSELKLKDSLSTFVSLKQQIENLEKDTEEKKEETT